MNLNNEELALVRKALVYALRAHVHWWHGVEALGPAQALRDLIARVVREERGDE